ncbi:MAG TPA: DUF3891 family protein [Thermoanaerobaculia bacterium]|nr:DUF3891 family protein [Thermoanaerobaculia bacterium]
MLVRAAEDSLLLVTQADHARLAADLLALVRLPAIAAHPRRAELLRAVAEHDNGWWEHDAAPRVDADGRPIDFLAVGRDERCGIWERGVERFAAEAPYRAALVAAHALRLHADRWGDPDWAGFLGRLEARRDELLAAAGLGPAELADDDRWTALADGLSLALCLADARWLDAPGWRGEVAPEEELLTLRLDPFPFAGSSRLELRGRKVPARPYGRDAELALELASARWQRWVVRIAPTTA